MVIRPTAVRVFLHSSASLPAIIKMLKMIAGGWRDRAAALRAIQCLTEITGPFVFSTGLVADYAALVVA